MNRDDFVPFLEQMAKYGKEFKPYHEKILDIYRDHDSRNLYSASIYDYLNEKLGELNCPGVTGDRII
jgi:hypothetical protein